MKQKQIYLIIVHTTKISKNSPQVVEQVYVSDNISDRLLTTSNMIINIDEKIIVKSRSEFKTISVESVVDFYLNRYQSQILRFRQKYGESTEIS